MKAHRERGIVPALERDPYVHIRTAIADTRKVRSEEYRTIYNVPCLSPFRNIPTNLSLKRENDDSSDDFDDVVKMKDPPKSARGSRREIIQLYSSDTTFLHQVAARKILCRITKMAPDSIYEKRAEAVFGDWSVNLHEKLIKLGEIYTEVEASTMNPQHK